MSTGDNFNKELLYLVFQFLAEENLTEALHRLERESRLYFNLKYFEEKVLSGDWSEVETYLSSFTKLEDNRNSTKIYFEIRKHKYLEALDRHDKQNAVEILAKDLKVFEELTPETYKQMTLLLTLKNFRENEVLSMYGDMVEARKKMMSYLKQLIETNPVFEGKLTFPTVRRERLMSLMHQSLCFQHMRCTTPIQYAEATTLTTDHVCLPPNTSNQPVRAPEVYDPSNPLPPLASILTLALPQAETEMNHNNNDASSSVVICSNQEGSSGIKRSPMSIGDDLQQRHLTDQCLIVTLQESKNDSSIKIGKVMYTHGGDGVLALTTSGNHKFWKWEKYEMMGNVIPRLWKPDSGVSTRNDHASVGTIACLDIAKNDLYMLSAFGGNVGLFNMMTLEVVISLKTPLPISTFVAFHPQDNNVIVFGMEDSVIHIYHVTLEEVELKLLGHEKHVTGITFSCTLNLMVSSGADAQVLFWNSDKWEKENSFFLELPDGKEPLRSGETRVQFHTDQVLVLVSHETQLVIYDCLTMTRVFQWFPQGDLPSPISEATYSCDGSMIYATFRDACIGIFDSNALTIICRIAPNVYMARLIMDENKGQGNEDDSINALAAHPHYPNQFAVALSDGSVKVIEPKPVGRKWADQYIPEDTDNLQMMSLP